MSSGYDFNPEKEPATVQIEMNDRRYVKINERLLQIQNNTPGRESRMWVPPRVANDLTNQSAMDVSKRIPPIARMIGTRTAEVALAEAKGISTALDTTVTKVRKK